MGQLVSKSGAPPLSTSRFTLNERVSLLPERTQMKLLAKV